MTNPITCNGVNATLPLSASIAVEILRDLGSPGVALLDEIRAQEDPSG